MRYTKEQINKMIDDGVPLLIIPPTDPHAVRIARIVKDMYLLGGHFEQAAYARDAEKRFVSYYDDALTPAQKRAKKKALKEFDVMIKEAQSLIDSLEKNLGEIKEDGQDQQTTPG